MTFISEQYKKESKRIKKERKSGCLVRRDEIMALTGHNIKRFTNWHYRIDNALDIYPSGARFHLLKNQARGSYKEGELQSLVDNLLG